MCGIAGLWHFDPAPRTELEDAIQAMTTAIAYRGPDGTGAWIDAEEGIALGHRRLAIVDLSPAGNQPMSCANKRFVISYNGELYNTDRIASELAMRFRGHSDTEVLVEAIARYGVEGALARINGLFAFAVFDRDTRILHLARDRCGIKPLYWTRQHGLFAFASELKAFRSVRGLSLTIDPESIMLYLRHGCVPAPRTIYRDVFKLMPGEHFEASVSGNATRRYWDPVAFRGIQDNDVRRRSKQSIVEELHGLLADSVKRQMVSDVPIGAFLSGGIDSSTVVALMQRAAGKKVKTFSIGFEEEAFNEVTHARAIARHLETDHTEFVFSANEARSIIPMLPTIYDEPFADASQLPTFLVSRLAREHVTVALSGDGGDELFGGYVRYQSISRLWKVARRLPRFVRRSTAGAIELVSPAMWDTLAGTLPWRSRPRHFGDKVLKGAGLLDAAGPLDMYRRVMSQWPDPEKALVGTPEPLGWSDQLSGANLESDIIGELRLLDLMGYLPDDILTKVDRASMAVSLEVRVPLLDQNVVEFALQLPTDSLIVDHKGKWPLRGVLRRYVPPELIERPKMGFTVPIGEWLRGPLRDWAQDLLSPACLAADGLLAPKLIRARLSEHLAGKKNWQHALWPVLQFQAWRRAYH